MISTYKNKRSTRTNRLRQLLPKTSIQIIGDDLSTKSTTQKEKKMKMKIKRRRKFLKNTKEHFREK